MRELLIIRHAIAEERQPGGEEASRALTAEGRQKMALAALGLKRLQPQLDTLLTSPLLRAEQTAEMVGDCIELGSRKTLKTLSPGYSTTEVIAALNRVAGRRLAIVGHEPQLSMLIAALLCRDEGADIELKKGGMAQLLCGDTIAPGGGTLQWLLTPKQLRLLGKGA